MSYVGMLHMDSGRGERTTFPGVNCAASLMIWQRLYHTILKSPARNKCYEEAIWVKPGLGYC